MWTKKCLKPSGQEFTPTLADCPAVSLDLCITDKYPNVKQLSWAINYTHPRVHDEEKNIKLSEMIKWLLELLETQSICKHKG